LTTGYSLGSKAGRLTIKIGKEID